MAGQDVRQLLLQVDASVALAQRNLNQLAAQVQADSGRMDRALATVDGASDRLGRTLGGLRNIAASLGITLGAVGALQGVRTFLDYADAAKTLEAQLRLATAQSGSFAQAQDDVRRIATETRSGLAEVATLYGTFQRNATELGISQQQAARATQTVTEALRISGSTVAEAAGGTRQFIQAIQSGVLRGEEFNSVMENSPRLARLIADSLGVTIGQLRAMAEQGEITSDKLIAALTDQRFTDSIDAEFRELPVTFDQSMTQVRNAATITFGAFDRGGQFSTALANFVSQGSEGFAQMEGDAEQAGVIIRSVFEGLSDVFGPLLGGWDDAESYILAGAQRVALDIARLLGEIDTVINRYTSAANSVDNFANRYLNPMIRLSPGQAGAAPFFAPGARAGSDMAGDFARGYAESVRGLAGRSRGGPARPGSSPSASRGGASRSGGSPRRGTGGGGGRSRSTRREPSPAEQREMAPGYGNAINLPDLEQAQANFRALVGLSDELQTNWTEGLADFHSAMDEIARFPIADIIGDEQLRRLQEFSDLLREDVAGSLADAIVAGEDLGDALVNSFKRAAAALIESSLLELLGGSNGGLSIFSLIGSFTGGGQAAGGFSALFGGFRADGGDIMPGRFYVTGERGPEIVVPKVPSVVIPNYALGRGGGAVHNHYYVRGNVLTPEFWAEIGARDQRAAAGGTAGAMRVLGSRAARRFPTGV